MVDQLAEERTPSHFPLHPIAHTLRRMHELITIKISHYCEKARWALDRGGVAYREHGYMPAFHFPFAARALLGTGNGATDGTSTRFSTPLLVGQGGSRWADSTEIARYADPSLFELEEAEALDRHFSENLGAHTRRIVYWYALPDRPRLERLARENVGATQARLFVTALPVLEKVLRKSLRITEEGCARSVQKVDAIADEVAERLSDGRRYLVGDRFTIADLSFASLFSIVVMPPEYGATLMRPEELDGGLRAHVERYRAHPAGQFALRMFREHRAERAQRAA